MKITAFQLLHLMQLLSLLYLQSHSFALYRPLTTVSPIRQVRHGCRGCNLQRRGAVDTATSIKRGQDCSWPNQGSRESCRTLTKENKEHKHGSRRRQIATLSVSSSAEGAVPVYGALISEKKMTVEEVLEEWASAKSMNTAGLRYDTCEGLRGLVATEPIASWDTLMSVSEELLLSVFKNNNGGLEKKGNEEDDKDGAKPLIGSDVVSIDGNHHHLHQPPSDSGIGYETWIELPWYIRLGLLLIMEKNKGPESPISAYIAALPNLEVMDPPMIWPKDQLEALKYPFLNIEVEYEVVMIKKYQEQLHHAILNCPRQEVGAMNHRHTKTRASLLSELSADSTALMWAVHCVLSRSFDLPPYSRTAFQPLQSSNTDSSGVEVEVEGEVTTDDSKVALLPAPAEPAARHEVRVAFLPWLDSANHYSRIPTHLFWTTAADDSDGGADDRGDGNGRRRRLGVSVGVPYEAGEQVFINYGPIPNDKLLQNYGFVERDNPSDHYVLNDLGCCLSDEGMLNDAFLKRLSECGQLGASLCLHLQRGIVARRTIHPLTMHAVRLASACFKGKKYGSSEDGDGGGGGGGGGGLGRANAFDPATAWDGTKNDLQRFAAKADTAVEMKALALLLLCCRREAERIDLRSGPPPPPPPLPSITTSKDGRTLESSSNDDGDDGDDVSSYLLSKGFEGDRLIMAEAFMQEKRAVLQTIISSLQYYWKMADLLNKAVNMPPWAGSTVDWLVAGDE